ncbi:hypothetical protein LZ30DRAFT_206073 [Colletotrichum cereale]|nr:hypothetical protein LZ30DRAFT_206073 [Colletotrichum cereale]
MTSDLALRPGGTLPVISWLAGPKILDTILKITMWKPPYSQDAGSITGSVGAAAIYAILAHWYSSEQAEISSELLCWLVLIPLLRSSHAKSSGIFDFESSKASLPRDVKQDTKPASHPASLWVVAIAVVTVSLYKAECKRFVAFCPLLHPLFLAVQKRAHRSDPVYSAALRPNHSRIASIVFDSIPATLLAGAFTTLTLSGWDLQASMLSIIPAAGMLVVYVALDHGNRIERTPFLPRVDLRRSILPLASRVVALLVVCLIADTVLFGFQKLNIPATFALGFAKALSWYSTARAANVTSWRIAPAVETFSTMSTLNPFSQPSEFLAVSNVAASLLSLGSIIHMVPRVTRSVSVLWVLAFAPLVPYFANTIAITSARSAAQTFATGSHGHPVEQLSRAANVRFKNMLKSQSKTYTAAYAEYQRRYGLEPPPGFDAWYEFAVANRSPVIDDFDSILDSLSPLLGMSGQEVGETIRDAYDAPGNDLWLCSFSRAQAETRCEHPYRTFDRHIASSFNARLESLVRGSVPDIKFLVNHIDEPRVLVPPLTARDTRGAHAFENERFCLKTLSGRPVHRELTKYCMSQNHTRSTHGKGVGTADDVSVETYGLPFVADPRMAAHLCQYPSQGALHGLIARPQSFKLIEGPVPVLSTGSLATMGDILFPSPAYMEDEFRYEEGQDVEWLEKRNNVYWAGSSTGGLASDGRWREYHRQRFVALAQNLQKPEKQKHVYLRQIDGVVERVASSFLNSRLYDVAFTRIFQCERTQCRDQKSYFNVRSWVGKDEALRSRLVFDLDGNGISGRFYKLLASKSTPLKQTLLREWHDERLVPWVHYVPVSLGMGELPELVTYLTTSEAGQQRAREIAGQGRDWYFEAFRDVDSTIYLYRLLLEMARLGDPDRQAI